MNQNDLEKLSSGEAQLEDILKGDGPAHSNDDFFRMIVENDDDFIAVLDLEGRRIYNNPSYAKLFGDTEWMKGLDSFAEIHPDDRERVISAFRDTVRSGHSHRLNFRFVLANGSVRQMESCGTLIRNNQAQALRVVVVSRDITERVEKEQRIQNLAFYDTLTQLPNRHLLNDRLNQAMSISKRSGRYVALMFLDLDNFKLLNDTHGHWAGDLLLSKTGPRITSCLREMDTVARFGGDEFAMVLTELSTDKAESVGQSSIVAEAIRTRMAEPFVLKFQQEGLESTIEYHCTVSIGVVLFIGHEASNEDIFKRADMAMYQAKEAGRNLTRFYGIKFE